MLRKLFIRDIVLIDQLSLSFASGLTVLTGETGAGKSVLLDALSLAIGGRAEAALLRHGADKGSVTAEFEAASSHPVHALLEENEIEVATGEDVILRRSLGSDGRSKAFINDQPVSVGLLRSVGDTLVEIHGQHDERGLLNPAGHRRLLDAFGGHEKELDAAAAAHAAWRKAEAELAALQRELAKDREQEDYDRHCLDEIEALSPEAGEEDKLAEERRLMMEGKKAAAQLDEARQLLGGEETLDTRLRSALRRLDRLPEALREPLGEAITALERAAESAEEGIYKLDAALSSFEYDEAKLERVEERLFALKALARKHNCPADELPELAEKLRKKLSALEQGGEALEALKAKAGETRKAFEKAAAGLTAARKKAAAALDQGVAKELSPLKLGKARFRTRLIPLGEDEIGAEGAERAAFEVSTNPGEPFGGLIKIASGGELSRFILALKVVLAREGSAPCLIFDEVDRGIGGAVADAVGERLLKLARASQVLVITHSPQVAARADRHWRLSKIEGKKAARIAAAELGADGRREEIARMLSGARITDKARAAAESLIAGGGAR